MKFIPLVLSALLATCCQADSVGQKPADDSVAAEMAAFEVADGYEINLFASEDLGVAKPIAIRWDARGRLWVLCSQAYPQMVPVDVPDDKLFILEDTNGDGTADKSTIFASGLAMPTGFALGDGGVYLVEGENLFFLQDKDGDDKVDSRTLLFSGFGTGDTHQNINSFTWSPGGELLFCQGLHTFSHIQTPWGMTRLDEHGVWRMRPRRLQLHAYRGASGQNPWGIEFGRWGEPWVKGNNPQLSELLPVMVPTDHYQQPLDIGATQIKSMILCQVDSPHLPPDIQGHLLIAGYFARNIERMEITADASGHKTKNFPLLLRSGFSAFRPVDISVGPDGAIYVADWYNPIIGHYQASFRHPDRDKNHGRIWRITAKGRPLAVKPVLEGLTTPQLVAKLGSTVRWERDRVREMLSARPTPEVVSALEGWVAGLAPDDPDREKKLFEALCQFEWHESVNELLLQRLLQAREPLARAYATRVVGRWHDRLPEPLVMLEKSVVDESPRVRLEAVVACSYIPDPKAAAVALRALEKPVDRFLTAALSQMAHALYPLWNKALLTGNWECPPTHLAWLLQQTSREGSALAVRQLLETPELSPQVKSTLYSVLAATGNSADLSWILERASRDAFVMETLAKSARVREVVADGDFAATLAAILEQARLPGSGGKDERLEVAVIDLVGSWKPGALIPLLEALAFGKDVRTSLRVAALDAVARAKGPVVAASLEECFLQDSPREIRQAALAALAEINTGRAAVLAGESWLKLSDEKDVAALLAPFLTRANGLEELAKALTAKPVDPVVAGEIRATLGAVGRYSAALDKALGAQPGDAFGSPAFADDLVASLASDVKEKGNAAEGERLFLLPQSTCVACHKVGDTGGVLGPDLSAVGAGLPLELMIEAVLWPERQVKEGYLATTITTKSGAIISGYRQSETKEVITIRDAATGELKSVATGQIAQRVDAGTLMPPGLVAGLTRQQVVDLIKYLAGLQGK
jgi:putative heme-binding domain-containing protein